MPIGALHAALVAAVVLGGAGAAQRVIQAVGGRPPAARVPRAQADTLVHYDRVLALEPKAETSANVSVGDVNGDGRLDVVLAKGRHWPLVDRVLLGDGRGHFAAGVDLGPTADRSYSGRLVDLDRDGDLDVVISNDAPDPKRVYLNDGAGRFRPGSTYGRPEWPTRNATVADVNGDGLPDIVVANRGDSATTTNFVCLNRGGGRFDADCVPFSHEPATTIAAADFDGDGHVDLAVPHRDGGQSRVYLGGPKGTFSAARTVPFGPRDASIRVAEAADLDGDGRLDLVTIDERTGAAIHFGRREGGFGAAVAVGGRTPTPYALAIGDLNGDRKPDVVVGHVEAPSAAYFNDGTGRRFQAVRFGDGKGTAYGFALADLDGDGVVDVAVARSEATNVVYFGDRRGARTAGRR